MRDARYSWKKSYRYLVMACLATIATITVTLPSAQAAQSTLVEQANAAGQRKPQSMRVHHSRTGSTPRNAAPAVNSRRHGERRSGVRSGTRVIDAGKRAEFESGRRSAALGRAARAHSSIAHPSPSQYKLRDVRRGGRLVRVAYAIPRPAPIKAMESVGHAVGLAEIEDPLDLRASVAFVVDQSGHVIVDKNSQAVLPIASLTKLMTALVVVDARQPLTEMLEISDVDVDLERHSRSRLPVGTRLTRGDMLQLALMASENRAANALSRYWPGGTAAFVEAMNEKARSLGMVDTVFADPTGLSAGNTSHARDLSKLARAAYHRPMVRQQSIANELSVDTGYRVVMFRNTNRLVGAPDWEIGLSKTGFITEAGNCLIMQAKIDSRSYYIVLLDSAGKQTRLTDMQRVRRWIGHAQTVKLGLRQLARQM